MKYAILLSLIGAGQMYLAVEYGGIAWVLAWSGLSFLIVGTAYARLGPRVFGKRPDGRLPWWSVVLLPYLIATWSLWHLQRLLSQEPCCHEVAPGIWLGRRPFLHELPEGVVMVVDLTAEFPEARGLTAGRSYCCLPTLDHSAPDGTAFQELARKVAASPGPVLIHCAAGHGRSAALAAAVLIARGLVTDPEDAIRQISAARPGVRLADSQIELLKGLSWPG